MSHLRLFVAIELPGEVKEQLCLMQPHAPGVRRIKPHNIHLTLHFIGEAQLEPLRLALEPISTLGPFDLRLSGVGRFQGRGRNVIFWTGVEPDDALRKLHANIGRMLTSVGIAIEQRPYCPHVTIARGEHVDKLVIENFMQSHVEYSAVVRVNAVHLMSSVTSPSGPVYTIERSYALGDTTR